MTPTLADTAPARLRAAWASTRAIAYATYQEWAAYRSHMLLSLLVGPTFFLVQVVIWQALLGDGQSIAGYDRDALMRYYAAVLIVGILVFDFADWNLQMLIRSGKFLTFLLRPISHRAFAFSQKLGHRCLGFWMEALPIYLILWGVFSIRLVPARPLWFVLSLALGFVIMFLVNYCVGTLAFWLTRTNGLRRLIGFLRDLCAGVFLPLALFPDAVQQVLFYLPFQFITYVPIQVLLGDYRLGGYQLSIPAIVGCQALMALAMWGVSVLLWRAGLRRFTAAGV
ncbi:ABC transporter permease [Jeongeupia sp. HS-3]|uniref:ABC transporter permease n=1 Tax=Jeongeupia sp. HS-3 TaxID=1009682 RepID=UPI0018A43AB9|nr:ABC-2 family transporter protein [Jeongeupia sp. HS-3]BCL74736.1 ABC transporter permease [Jeongeupia sp. HS-3]